MIKTKSRSLWPIVNHWHFPQALPAGTQPRTTATLTPSLRSFSQIPILHRETKAQPPASPHPLLELPPARSLEAAAAAMDTRLHVYYPRRTLVLSEYIPRVDLTQPRQDQHQPPNVLLFIGGMYDNFRSPRYVDDLAALFPRDEPDQKWSVFHVQLSSAGKSFGLVDLDRDVCLYCNSFLEFLCP